MPSGTCSATVTGAANTSRSTHYFLVILLPLLPPFSHSAHACIYMPAGMCSATATGAAATSACAIGRRSQQQMLQDLSASSWQGGTRTAVQCMSTLVGWLCVSRKACCSSWQMLTAADAAGPFSKLMARWDVHNYCRALAWLLRFWSVF
jgi:hypothetical protein